MRHTITPLPSSVNTFSVAFFSYVSRCVKLIHRTDKLKSQPVPIYLIGSNVTSADPQQHTEERETCACKHTNESGSIVETERQVEKSGCIWGHP